MLTVFKINEDNHRVQIGTTDAHIAEDKKQGIGHTVINTDSCENAVAFLEAASNLTPGAVEELETLLTIVYRAGQTAK